MLQTIQYCYALKVFMSQRTMLKFFRTIKAGTTFCLNGVKKKTFNNLRGRIISGNYWRPGPLLPPVGIETWAFCILKLETGQCSPCLLHSLQPLQTLQPL